MKKAIKEKLIYSGIGRFLLRLWYLYMHRDTVGLARILGVKIGGCKIIGDNAIIGGHSVVTKDVPSDAVFAGNPAVNISGIDSFRDRSRKKFINTKHMSHMEKRVYLEKIHPEWFM